jgi:rhomboid protease GluP
MANCLNCGRELPSPDGGQLCPECQSALLRAHAQTQARRPSALSVAMKHMPVSSAIIAVNAAVFIAMTASGVSPGMPHPLGLIRWGADWGPLTLTTQPWRILTSNYVHAGILHIGLNMWCLWNLGALAERIFDRWTYILTYTACGLAGSIASLRFHPVTPGVGASGAIFGIAGALIAALYLGHLPVPPGALKATLKSLISFAAYNLFFGAVVAFIDNSAHLGGLITGLVLGAALAPRLTSSPDERNSWRRFVFIGATVVLALAFYFVRRSLLRTA